ncbi:hypothetical protein QJS04_geneDACA024708 [Acorus gramineus]|uniref:RNase H type-1 domain-containing protein n=1 Tax=Acorus gramineus TaxID=55184 RepID=A0AAV9BWF3_ACOGR|nr:hypothetical protein QJS04_geneDACA024708 [Acorus gramineus]
MVVLKRIRDSINVRTLDKVFQVSPTLEDRRIATLFGLQTIEHATITNIVTWIPPLEGWFKLNSDGSLGDDRGGYGALLRNSRDAFIIGIVGRLDLPSINLLELKAIEQGIWMAITTGVDKLWIESDSTTALAWVHGKGNAP